MNLKRCVSTTSFFFIFILLLTPQAYADALAPFTTDGCSSFPDGTLKEKQLFFDCCKTHDFAYWQGGTEQQRLDADQTFAQCIVDLGKPLLAKAMYAGVRVGGLPYWPTPFRWGYGWPYPREYGQLTLAELAQVSQLTPPEFQSKNKGI